MFYPAARKVTDLTWIAADVGLLSPSFLPHLDSHLVVLTATPKGVYGTILPHTEDAFLDPAAHTRPLRTHNGGLLWSSCYSPVVGIDASSGSVSGYTHRSRIRHFSVIPAYIVHILRFKLAHPKSIATWIQPKDLERVLHVAAEEGSIRALTGGAKIGKILGPAISIPASVNLYRKSDLTLWPWLGDVLGSPTSLLHAALDLGDLVSAVNIFVVTLSQEGISDESLSTFQTLLEAISQSTTDTTDTTDTTVDPVDPADANTVARADLQSQIADFVTRINIPQLTATFSIFFNL